MTRTAGPVPHLRRTGLALGLVAAFLAQAAVAAAPGAGLRPVDAHKARLLAACREAGGSGLVSQPGFARRADLNGDGKPDLVLDSRYLDCRGAAQASPFCGTGGCGLAVFVSTRAGLVKAFDGDAIAAAIVPAAGGDRLDLSVHGTQCGLWGMAECHRILRWTGTTLAP